MRLLGLFILLILVAGCAGKKTSNHLEENQMEESNLNLETDNDSSGVINEIESEEKKETTIANPASEYCIGKGGELEIRNTAKGEAGFCILPEGIECEEWDFYNGHCPDEKKAKESKITTSEIWIKESTVIFADTTSSSSIVLDDGTVRTYIHGEGGIFFSESSDGKTFTNPVTTNVNGEVSNPAIVHVDNKYILFYNKASGKDNEGSGTDQLWRTESTDGKTFYASEKVADRLTDSDAVVDVPDVIVLPDGSLRIYGTQTHDGINTARSTDLGMTWKTDGSNLVSGGAADPDVHIEGTKYVMYYTETIIPDEYMDLPKEKIQELGVETNTINKAVSSDGIDWEKEEKDVITSLPEIPKSGAAVDPDYIEMKDGTKILLFGKGIIGDGIESTNIYRAVKD